MSDSGNVLKIQGFLLAWMLSESAAIDSMIGHLASVTATFLLSLLIQNYEVALFCFFLLWSKVTLSEVGVP